MTKKQQVEWAKLLEEAVTEPGTVATCYSRFWNYSLLNQLFVLGQCAQRDLQPGPVSTFKGWLRLNRHVNKGEQGLFMWMPRTGRAHDINPQTGEEEEREFLYFVCKPFWFVLSQTDGDEYVPEPLPKWDPDRALKALDVDLADFTMPDGNCQGYAHDRVVAVNPVAEHPTKTLVHELAHVILGHTEKDVTMVDTDVLSRDVKEMEAEAVALLVGDALELDGAAESRGYIQHWYGKDRRIDDANARRIISAADKVLRAGRPEKKQSKKEDA